MSFASTLIKVAIGVAVAKGVSTLVKGANGSGTTSRSAGQPAGIDNIMDGIGGTGRSTRTAQNEGGIGDLLDQISGQSRSRTRHNAPKGGLEDMLGGGGQSAGQGGGLGDLLGQLTGGGSANRSTPQSGGGLGDLLGQLTGATSASRGASNGGGLGDLLGQLTGGGRPQSGGGLGDLLGAVLGGADGGALAGAGQDSRQEDLAAALILRAMVAAVKADGQLDDAERDKLTQHADGASQEEIAYIKAELQRQTSVDDLAAQVPQGMEAKVYLMSLLAIDLDNQKEAQYLDSLAKALALEPAEVNALHERAGAPTLYN